MGACQPTQLMTITNFVIVISLGAQLKLTHLPPAGSDVAGLARDVAVPG